jgi:hypothetical protein
MGRITKGIAHNKVMASLDFGDMSLSSVFPRRAPHLIHISAIGFVSAPQALQKLVPARGLAPQPRQISGVSVSSLPQFLQNIISSFLARFAIS